MLLSNEIKQFITEKIEQEIQKLIEEKNLSEFKTLELLNLILSNKKRDEITFSDNPIYALEYSYYFPEEINQAITKEQKPKVQAYFLDEINSLIACLSRPKVAVLLDIDHTLLFPNEVGKEPILNTNLLKALKQLTSKWQKVLKRERIKIYLFSDMTFKTETVIEREKLIKDLKEMGFDVCSVSTPADYTWHIDDEIAENFQVVYDKNLNAKRQELHISEGRSQLEENHKRDIILGILTDSKYASINQLVNGIIPAAIKNQDKELGSYFEAVKLVDGQVPEHIRAKSERCKVLTDAISYVRRIPGHTSLGVLHSKALMLEHIIENKPPDINSFIVFDDRKDCLDAVLEMNQEFDFPLSVVRVEKETPTEQFEEQIRTHLNRIEDTESVIDIEGTLLIKVDETEKGPRYKLNDALIQAHKKSNVTKICLIGNAGTTDLEKIKNYAQNRKKFEPLCIEYDSDHPGYYSIPYSSIEDYLMNQGFVVQVITPADMDYGYGPGCAYRHLLKPAYQDYISNLKQIKFEENDTSKKKIEQFNKSLQNFQHEDAITKREVKYFLDQKSRKIKRVICFENGENSLSQVSAGFEATEIENQQIYCTRINGMLLEDTDQSITSLKVCKVQLEKQLEIQFQNRAQPIRNFHDQTLSTESHGVEVRLNKLVDFINENIEKEQAMEQKLYFIGLCFANLYGEKANAGARFSFASFFYDSEKSFSYEEFQAIKILKNTCVKIIEEELQQVVSNSEEFNEKASTVRRLIINDNPVARLVNCRRFTDTDETVTHNTIRQMLNRDTFRRQHNPEEAAENINQRCFLVCR